MKEGSMENEMNTLANLMISRVQLILENTPDHKIKNYEFFKGGSLMYQRLELDVGNGNTLKLQINREGVQS